MRNENQLTGFLSLLCFLLSLPLMMMASRKATDAGRVLFHSEAGGSVSGRSKVQKICTVIIKNRGQLPFVRIWSGQVVAGFPFYFASEAFYFVNDQVIYVEGGILSVL
jgi:hypothetical protein